jgi:hypothetical protein
MDRYRRKIINSALIAGLALVVVAIVSAVALFAWNWYRDPALTLVRAQVLPADDVYIGTPILCVATIEAPWHRWPLKAAELHLPEGLQSLKAIPPRLVGIGAGKWRWSLAGVVQAYDVSEKHGVSLDIQFTANRQGDAAPLTVEMPPIKVRSRLTGGEPRKIIVANTISERLTKPPRSWQQWIGLLLLTLIVTLVVISLLRRRELHRAPPPLSPWQQAQLELQQLREQTDLPASRFFVQLTDIVRRYIQKRFDIPAGEQTTVEFLRAAEQDVRLAAAHKQMLADFLTAADMVKFARAAASPAQMQEALAKANAFVAETTPSTGGAA